jgi:xanthine dehydrogenase YagR molybdenum-binding subunit
MASARRSTKRPKSTCTRYVNDNLADYLIPVNADLQVEVILVSEEDRDVNPAGVKGLGELGNVGAAAAVSNAAFHATGPAHSQAANPHR